MSTSWEHVSTTQASASELSKVLTILLVQRLRNCILEIIHRLPMNHADVLKGYAAGIVDLLMGLVRTENEDNVILCMKAIMDLERHQPEACAARVQPFLDLILELFEAMEHVVKDTFDTPVQNAASGATPSNPQSLQSPRPNSPAASSTSTDLDIGLTQNRQLLKGMQSFKVFAECPIIVVSLFQAHRNCVPNNVKKFVPLIKKVLMLQASPQKRAHEEAQKRGEVFIGVSREIKNRHAFGELITAQVKMMSFLAYLLRVYVQQLNDFLQLLPEIVVRLLRDCPSEKSATRKELLVAIRHTINFNFRKIFLARIDDLLDERTMLGDGLTVYESMRPLAYSLLADLIHHIRDSLTRDQIRKTVEVFSKNLHDQFPGTSFQTMSAKLLLNMADVIANLPDKIEARHFLIEILNAIGDKFADMNHQYHNAVKLSKNVDSQSIDSVAEDYLEDRTSPPDWDEVDIFSATPIKLANPKDRGANPVEDNRFLFKNLLTGLKGMFYQLKMCNPEPPAIDPGIAPPNWPEVSFGYNAEEVEVIRKLFRQGAKVFRYYSLDKPFADKEYTSPVEFLANNYGVQGGKEEKDLLETFATVFHSIDPATFHEVFHSEIPVLYEMMFEHPALLHVPQFFLASEATSPAFAGMLLQFLMDRIAEVGTSDIKKSSILLRLFKLSFMAVTLFSSQNEAVLLPHVTGIVTKSIQLSTTADEPMNYFYLLRSLFRSIGGGRFELLYKEILPLLEMLLEVLNNLLMAARKPQERDLYVELCLTVPARLSNLLPHLSYLMRPLVVALRAGSDLVGQGLRTLELCVDNLTAEYLDPIMAPVIDELMSALWDHLEPTPYSHFHSHTTMRILGKLGGRNRKFLNGPPELKFQPYADETSTFDIRVLGSGKDRRFPAKIGIDLAIAKLVEIPKQAQAAAKKVDPYYKQQALRLVTAQLKMHIGFDSLPDDFAQIVRLQAIDLSEDRLESSTDDVRLPDREKSISNKDAQQDVLKKLLKALMLATTLPDLEITASSLLVDICRHFTILETGKALAQAKQDKRGFDVRAGEGPLCLDSSVLADAIAESLSSDKPALRDTAEKAINLVFEAATVIFGSSKKAEKFPFFVNLAKLFCHKCYEEDWFVKAGGSLGIQILTTKMDIGDDLIIDKQLDFVRSLFFVIKDMPQDLPANTRIQSLETLESLLRRCMKGTSKADLGSDRNTPEKKSPLWQLCEFIVLELKEMNKHVRNAARKAMAIIGESVGADVYEIIAPFKATLLRQVYSKPLRALPFTIQIAYIDAVTYCMELKHELVDIDEHCHRLLLEALALADANDDTLAPKPGEYKTAEHIINLRVACVKILALALNTPEFSQPQQAALRGRVISVFFKSLYSNSKQVIDAATAGLKGVLSQTNKLPKDLLQNGLRPILMNLQDAKKLSEQGLDGLARLLALLTNYFKTEIGEKLLGHMGVIADITTLQQASFSLIEQKQPMKIIVAAFNIFHLLPPTATVFMEGLIDKVLDLEKSLRRTHFSPFREPLLKYLSRYSKESWAFFAGRLAELKYGRFFAQILTAPRSGPLRDVVTSDIEGFMKASFDLEDLNKQTIATINAIHMIHSILSQSSAWLVNEQQLRQRLMHMGHQLNERRKGDHLTPEVCLAADQASEQLMEIFVKILELLPDNVEFLFQLFSAVTAKHIKIQPSLFSFIYHKILLSEDLDYWRKLAIRSLDVFNASDSPNMKTFVFRNLLNPILAMDTWRGYHKNVKGARLIDKSMIDAIHNKIWKTQMNDPYEEITAASADHSRLEMLEMSALLLKYHPNLVSEARKDLIKFVWQFMKLDDIINKHANYVLIAYFIAQFDTPVKIVNQIYVSLLKAHQNEGRALVVQALDLIAPILPKRLGAQSDSKYPIWAKWAKRVLSEESSNLQQLIGIFQFMVRHQHLFYEAREHFITHIIPQLSKIAQLPTPSNEHKKLVLNLIQMIFDWEDRRLKGVEQLPPQQSDGSPTKKRKALEAPNGGEASPAPSAGPPTNAERPEYQIPTQLRTMLIKYLTQFISVLPERYPVPNMKLRDLKSTTPIPQLPPIEMSRKALALFHDLLQPKFWSDLDVDLFPRLTEQTLASDRTDKFLAAEKPDEKTATNIINALQVVRIVLDTKSDEWVLSQIPQIQRLLAKVMRSDHPEIQDAIHTSDEELDGGRKIRPLLPRVIEAIPQEVRDGEDEMEVETPGTDFMKFVNDTATSTMGDGNIIASIYICSTLSEVRPKDIEQHIPLVMKALQGKLAKDQVQQPVPAPSATGVRPGEGQPAGLDEREAALATQLCLRAIDIISSRMANLGDQRRPFLSVLASLVERSINVELREKILKMVEQWIFVSKEPFPTLKEKTAVLHKMLLFENRSGDHLLHHRSDDHLLHQFLDLVIRIYEDPQITRTELTVRLEHAFLIGTRAHDVEMRNRFMNVFDRSLTKTASARLLYVLTSQNWDTLAETFWLSQAIQLIFGAIDMNLSIQLNNEDFKLLSPQYLFDSSNDLRKDELMLEDSYEELMAQHRRFYTELGDVKTRDILEPLCQLQHTDSNVAYEIWVALFPLCWSLLSRDDRSELEKGMVTLLTKDYHQRQLDHRPNVVQALLEGDVRAKPKCKIPSHVMKFLAKTYDSWYTAALSLEEQATTPPPEINTASIRESTLDALVEVYSALMEEDFFYGTWRRRCKFVETNAALSYEQMGMWDKAQQLYEQAQIKARTGVIPYSQGEYMLWEDHWVLCAQKLQQWDILGDYAKHENFNDLLLEASWRNLETWSGQENMDALSSIIKAVSDAPTPRRAFFQSFMSLLKVKDEPPDMRQEFERIVNESIQLSIRKWHQLPKRITNAHVPILQNFQQLVELHDANVICTSLIQTNQQNLDHKSGELKLLLGTWRDRLPNVWDDINSWQDLVTWRQHIFQLINRTYLSLLGPQQNNAAGNSFAYRGYHETAWIINRFAHVARKHQLPDVCVAQLGRIYTLPNIEIQEAFLKLREQAKCHYQNRTELTSGLDVINNTNLSYFGHQQKAEFFTLKGMFLAKLQRSNEANDAFGTALYYDIRLPKAWAEWGFYNDMKFKENHDDLESASAAVSCYLEAAGLYKSQKSRKLLSRILWLLSIDTAENKISSAFEEFKGETPVWYWITFIPQLLTSLSHREAKLARSILMKISKTYPQSLYFSLRTTREDLIVIKKAQDDKRRRLEREKQQQPNGKPTQGSPETHITANERQGSSSRPGTANGESAPNGPDAPKPEPSADWQPTTNGDAEAAPKQPWEYADEIMQTLKTTFPLLALSMETMVDQIQKYFKCPPDEDAYRLIVALLNDGLSVCPTKLSSSSYENANVLQYISRNPCAYAQDFKLPQATEANIRKFAETILPSHIRGSFEEDFVSRKPTMYEYIQKLRKWRDKFEEKLDRRQQTVSLESYSHHLSEFRFKKFDEVEVPGQYLLHRDKNQDFVRIERFLPNVDLVRTVGFSHRRLKIRGHDGSVHPFAVQHPAARHSRREERTLQLFRIFNTTLSKRKESRRRNLNFHLPLIQPLAPSLRLVQDDPSYISLQGIYEDHCRRTGADKDSPILFTMERMRPGAQPAGQDPSTPALRMEIFTAISAKWASHDIALQYFQATYPSFPDFFLFRRQFSYQLAALTFMTYIMHMSARFPHKLTISRATGNIWGSELIPALVNNRPIFHNPEQVPFRLTPNLQTLMGPLATEGLFSAALMAIARCLTEVHHEPGNELEQQLSIFVRDEMIFWFTQQHKSGPWEKQLRETVQANSDSVVKRAVSLAKPPDGTLPANQTVVDFIARAVDPKALGLMDALWMAWL